MNLIIFHLHFDLHSSTRAEDKQRKMFCSFANEVNNHTTKEKYDDKTSSMLKGITLKIKDILDSFDKISRPMQGMEKKV